MSCNKLQLASNLNTSPDTLIGLDADKDVHNVADAPKNHTTQTDRKRLNDLDGKEWIRATKSVWLNPESYKDIKTLKDAMESGVLLSEAPSRDELKKKHPATFSEQDIAKLVRFFTRSGETVLDPFLGVGSSGIASLREGRNFVGIELYPEWFDIAKQRIADTGDLPDAACTLHYGDALDIMSDMANESIDFVVTSPPYWGILAKKDHKAKTERVSKGLSTEYGNNQADLANTKSYVSFIEVITEHLREYHRLLRPQKYVAIIVSDFRHGKEYYMFHSDIAVAMKRVGFTIQGLIVLVQDNKKLYPYGYPSTYVPNISNQFIVLGRKICPNSNHTPHSRAVIRGAMNDGNL